MRTELHLNADILLDAEPQNDVFRLWWLTICGHVAKQWKKERGLAAKNDWIVMVCPSIFTKTFGRTLIDIKIINDNANFSQFIVQNLKYAGPEIALISALVVFFYLELSAFKRGFKEEYLRQQKELKEEEKNGWSRLYLMMFAGYVSAKAVFKESSIKSLKVFMKFFIVYMSWALAMGLVRNAAWFSGSFHPAMLVMLGVSSVGFLVAFGLKKLVDYCFPGEENEHFRRILKNVINIVIITLVFAAIVAFVYFFWPVVSGFLVVGGFTALSLFFTTLFTDVLFNKGGKMETAWKTLSRAYCEGTVWALVEHLAVNVIIGGTIGIVADVALVVTTVCLAIFGAGQIDAHWRGWHKSSRLQQIQKDFLQNSFPSELKKIRNSEFETPEEMMVAVNQIRQTFKDCNVIHNIDGILKRILAIRMLQELSAGSERLWDENGKVMQYIKTVQVRSRLPMTFSHRESNTYKKLKKAKKGLNLQVNNEIVKWLRQKTATSVARIRYQYNIDIDLSTVLLDIDASKKFKDAVNLLKQNQGISDDLKEKFQALQNTLSEMPVTTNTSNTISSHFTEVADQLMTLANENKTPTLKYIETSAKALDKKLYGKPPMGKKVKAAICGVIGATVGFVIGVSIGAAITAWGGGFGAIPGAILGAVKGFTLGTSVGLGCALFGFAGGATSAGLCGASKQKEYKQKKDSKVSKEVQNNMKAIFAPI